MSTALPVPGFPCPSEWAPDWSMLLQRYPVLDELRHCCQDQRLHREGDVLTHTTLVCDSLVEDSAWRRLPTEARNVIFAGALFHDVAKPAKTLRNADGSITSPGHAAAGAKLARSLLYREGGSLSGFSSREKVVSLVKHHGLPLHALDRSNPVRTVIRASLLTPGAHLVTLARADVAGRICEDQADLYTRIDLFEEICREAKCLPSSRGFPSDIGRFLYLQGERDEPDCEPYDETAFETVLLSGLPGAGKDTWIARNASHLPVVCLDAIRRKMGIAPDDKQGAVIQQAKEEARVLLRKKQAFVWNGTNITSALRAPLIQLFRGYKARVRIVYLETSYRQLLQRNQKREAPLPPGVLQRLIDRLEPPELSEAPSVLWRET